MPVINLLVALLHLLYRKMNAGKILRFVAEFFPPASWYEIAEKTEVGCPVVFRHFQRPVGW